MKTTASITTLALVAVAAAKTNYFGGISARSASPIHLQAINANDFGFWIGKQTASYCPFAGTKQASDCPPGNETAYSVYDPNTAEQLSLAVNVPGGQAVYVAKDGKLTYTEAHSGAIPNDATATGFVLSPGENFGVLGWTGNTTQDGCSVGGAGFLACPTKGGKGPWQVYGARADVKFSSKCLGFDFLAPKAKGIAAWQYE